MKLVVLAGGLGTRLAEETEVKPKPMVEIGGRPILWHILKIYSAHGINDFVICCGYKGYVIKEFFANYFLHTSDVTFDLSKNAMEVHKQTTEPWRVTLVDTGNSTMTGGRIKRVADYVGDERFCLTYGDSLGNIDISSLLANHQESEAECTVTAVQPPGRFGSVSIDSQNRVKKFQEKPQGDGGYINGGFFVCEPSVLDYIDSDETTWENEPLEKMASANRMNAFLHSGFWHPMDTLRDKRYLEKLWSRGEAPWKVW